MRSKLIAGNWKMHGSLEANNHLLRQIAQGATTLDSVELATLVPFPYLFQAQSALSDSPCHWGAQDVSDEMQGAFTGEVSATMLVEAGCRYVIVGHSERRLRHAETDQQVAAKAHAAIEAGLIPIICVGESRAEREAGTTLPVVFRQLDAILKGVGVHRMNNAVLAYEPVWAIGTGLSATAHQVQEVHSALRARLATADWVIGSEIKILYGGSVKPANALELMRLGDVDGALVGGASLVAEDFLNIGRAAVNA